MMAAPSAQAVASDFLFCLGLGCFVAALHGLLTALAGRGPVRNFAIDVVSFVVAAFLLCGFASARACAGLARWYMAAGMAVGALAWEQGVHAVLRLVWEQVLRTENHLTEPLRQRAQQRRERQKEARNAKKQEKQTRKAGKKQGKGKKMLQNREHLLYN